MNGKKAKGGIKETQDVSNISNNIYECLQLASDEEDATEADAAVNKKKKGAKKSTSASTLRSSTSSKYVASTVLKISSKDKEVSAAKASAVKASESTKVLQNSPPETLEKQAAVNDQSKNSEEMRSNGDGGQPPGSEQPITRSLMFNYPLVWIDLEMTGLDVEKDKILEIAVIVTDGRLDEAIEGPDLVIHQPDSVIESMNEWCQEQHKESGLVDRVRQSKVTLEEAEEKVIDFVSVHKPRSGLQLAGNCIYTDFWFIKKHMPRLAEYFSHVVVDVSSVRALSLRWHKTAWRSQPEKSRTHRAMDDIRESIAELRYFKDTIFK